jgi:hypothetical protein
VGAFGRQSWHVRSGYLDPVDEETATALREMVDFAENFPGQFKPEFELGYVHSHPVVAQIAAPSTSSSFRLAPITGGRAVLTSYAWTRTSINWHPTCRFRPMICQQPFCPDRQEMYLATDVIAVENELERILIRVVAVNQLFEVVSRCVLHLETPGEGDDVISVLAALGDQLGRQQEFVAGVCDVQTGRIAAL